MSDDITNTNETSQEQAAKVPEFKPTLADIISQLRADAGVCRAKVKEQLYGVIKSKLTIETQTNPNHLVFIITENELEAHKFSTKSKTVQNIVFEIAKSEGLTFNIIDNKDFYFEVLLKD